MNHLLISTLIFLPTGGSGLQPIQLGQGSAGDRDSAMDKAPRERKMGTSSASSPAAHREVFNLPVKERFKNTDPCTGEDGFS